MIAPNRAPSQKKKRSTKKWRQQRFQVWLRDDFRCVYCGQDLLRDFQTLFTATVDHVTPECQGGDDSLDNLVTCCMACNSLKGDTGIGSLETGRSMIAHLRAKMMGDFLILAKQHGIQLPRREEDVTEPAMLAYDALASLKAFVHSAHKINKQIERVAYRAARVDESLEALEPFRSLFEAPPEELTT